MTLLIYIVCLILRKAYILNISWNLWIVCSISWSQSHKKTKCWSPERYSIKSKYFLKSKSKAWVEGPLLVSSSVAVISPHIGPCLTPIRAVSGDNDLNIQNICHKGCCYIFKIEKYERKNDGTGTATQLEQIRKSGFLILKLLVLSLFHLIYIYIMERAWQVSFNQIWAVRGKQSNIGNQDATELYTAVKRCPNYHYYYYYYH